MVSKHAGLTSSAPLADDESMGYMELTRHMAAAMESIKSRLVNFEGAFSCHLPLGISLVPVLSDLHHETTIGDGVEDVADIFPW